MGDEFRLNFRTTQTTIRYPSWIGFWILANNATNIGLNVKIENYIYEANISA